MSVKIDPLTILLLLSALSCFATAFIAWRQRKRVSAPPMIVLGLTTGFWALCYLLEYNSTDLATKLFWNALKYPALTTLPIALSSFVLRFAGWTAWPGRRLLLVLLFVPTLTTLLVFTDEYHHFFWVSHELVKHQGFVELKSTPGMWYWIQIIYSYSLILSGFAAATLLLMRTWQVYQRQVLILSIGIGLPVIISIITLLSTHPLPGIDLNAITFAAATIFLMLSTRLDSITNVVPLAHANLVEQMRDGVLVLDRNKRVMEINSAAEQILSVTKQSLIGHTLTNLNHPVLETIGNALAGKTIRHEIEIEKDTCSNWYDVRVSTLRSNTDENAGYLAIWHNITERKQIERELRYNASHDPLTGIYNRMYYDEAIERISNEARWPVSIISIDLDNLKETNDDLGHAAGDELIRNTADILRKAFRQDDLVARIGGDEFAVLIMQSDEARAEILLDRLHEMVIQHNASSPRVPVEFSVGYSVAYYKDELHMAMVEADNQMYANKSQRKAGRNKAKHHQEPPR